MTREVEVSHWGQVWLEDMYTLQHTGAKLKGGFSRFDYTESSYGGGFDVSFLSYHLVIT